MEQSPSIIPKAKCKQAMSLEILRGANHHLVSKPPFALSVKQPWATLIVAGLKSVEVRTWWTRYRGRLLIHAGKVADRRPEGWAMINTPELANLAALRGGILGEVDLIGCVDYDTPEDFAAAALYHRNDPSWYRPGGLYGFVFHHPRLIAYHACRGHTMFFAVEGITLS